MMVEEGLWLVKRISPLIYLPGILWLGALVGWDKPVLQWGMTPFLLGDAFKVLLASAVLPLCWQMIKKLR